MPVVVKGEGVFRYHFPDGWIAAKFDELTFYTSHFQKVRGDKPGEKGPKAVDVVAYDPTANLLWLIEAKDYRGNMRTKQISVGQELAEKACGTLACLMAGRAYAGDTGDKKVDSLWKNAVQQHRIRFVFHLEQPPTHSRLFPQSIDPKIVKDVLDRAISAVDPHPFGGGQVTINAKGFGWHIEIA
jgi:hypothetical protein